MRYKRFLEYSWSHQNRLRRSRLRNIAEVNIIAGDAPSVSGQYNQTRNNHEQMELEQEQQIFEESSSESERSELAFDKSDQSSNHRSRDQLSSLPDSDQGHDDSDWESIHDDPLQSESEEDDSEGHQMNDGSSEGSASESTFDSDCNSETSNDEQDHASINEPVDEEPSDYNEPLYEGAPLTIAESSIAILSLSLRHNITGVLLADILRLIAIHCPADNKCKKTLYSFKKFFGDSQTPLVRHFYCGKCLKIVERQDSICPSCTEAQLITYFIEGPIISQLQALYKRPGFQELLNNRHRRQRFDDHFEDVYDGKVYKDLCKDNGFLSDPANISFTWYTDGVRIFKSSKFNIWPFYLIINELPYSERTKKQNVILAGLWFGDEKPKPNLFLRPFQDSIKQLRQGITVQVPTTEIPMKVKGIIVCGTCDLPAKALFLNMKQYNGEFGCQKCKQEGTYLFEDKVRVWPYEPLRLRTDAETAEHARQAFNADRAVCGVKGPSRLSTIVHQSMRGTAVDVMHCVDEGITKYFMKIWFDPQFSDHPSSLVQYRNLVDQRLKSLTPPSFVQRLNRSITEHLPYMKAHEMKAWLFYYSLPCISDVMEDKYLEHYKLLVLGISLLCQSSIAPEDVEIASRALQEFVFRFEHLYGKRHMSNNVHQLLHLAENVRQFGPLWTTSCYPFEDLNGRLKFMVHGSNSAQLQIFSTVSMFLHLTSLKAETLVEEGTVYNFCEQLESRHGRLKRHVIFDSVYIVGKSTELKQLTPELQHVLRAVVVPGLTFFYYRRLLRENVMYSSVEYQRSKRTNSSFAVYSEDGKVSQIGRIRCFIRITNCFCRSLCDCVARNYAIIQPCITQSPFGTCIDNRLLSTIHLLLGYEREEKAIDISCLKSVCFYCEIRDISKKYIVEPVNRTEWE